MNKKDLTIILLCMIFGLIASILINALVWWGIGNLVIYTFGLNYSWNFIHGMCLGLIQMVLFPSKIKLNLDSLKDEGIKLNLDSLKDEEGEKNEEIGTN